ncbi:hypothetical protein E5Q_05404 [Mixia osmundae IAM 14324]|uniref:Uncharacterized protein n=1 Tax=Mixia osmundae (strain CBS 9802 / IAM 14324 / JCM 22182 / KY 12970) TaxID=764103 RepID=G7E7A6_MIXOS|nr:hypothetical protein E5Q_05404 [Mixia osmundae IAM 14324]
MDRMSERWTISLERTWSGLLRRPIMFQEPQGPSAAQSALSKVQARSTIRLFLGHIVALRLAPFLFEVVSGMIWRSS